MTALTAARNTPRRTPGVHGLPVKAGVKLHAGALAVLSAGYVAPGSTAVGLIALGRVEDTVDNTGGADGALQAEVREGTYQFANSASADLITQADVGQDCYIVDDQTVAKTSATNTRSRAGKISAVDDDGVWVVIGLGL